MPHEHTASHRATHHATHHDPDTHGDPPETYLKLSYVMGALVLGLLISGVEIYHGIFMH
jgi:hypothetical protein